MCVNQEHCWVIVCDDCALTGGHEAHDDDGYTLHFTSEADAFTWATDNSWTTAETLRCRRCSAQHLCSQFGHFYGLWHPCTCHATVPDHAATGCPLIRACIYCGHHDLALLANLPTR